MATELERLYVTLEADLSNYQAGLRKADRDLDTFTREAETKTARVSKAIDTGMAQAATSSGRAAQQMQNLSYQLNDVVSGIASGQPAFQILAQQGGQIYQALGSNGGVAAGLKAVRDGVASVLTPTTLLAGGFAAAGVAAVVAGVQFASAQDDISRSLKGIGAASGATVKDINAIADRLAATRNIGVGAARDIATSLVATGKISVGNIEGIANLAPGLAKITGSDLDEAGQKLAKIFADPVAGAKEFIAILGGVNAATLRTIENLSEQGRRQEAIVALRNAVQPKIEAAVTPRSVVGQIYDTAKSYGSRAFNALGESVSGSLDEKPLEQRLAEARTRFEGARDRAATGGTRFPQELKADLDNLERQFAKVGEAKRKALNSEEVADLSLQAQPIFDKMDPDGEGLRRLQNNLALVGTAIAKINMEPDSEGAKYIEDYIARYGALAKGVDAVTAAQAKGGLAAKQAGDQADLARQTASLSNYERGLRQIIFQYEQMAKQQEILGNTSAASGFRAVGTQAVAAYNAQSDERAKAQIILPAGIVDTIVGAESSGNAKAKNPLSSASGPGQFIDATFVGYYRKEFGDAAKTMSDTAILAFKTDFAVNRQLIEAYARDNAKLLQDAGIPLTESNIYLGHLLDGKKAVSTIQAANANPDVPAASIVGADVAAKNVGFFGKGRTIGQSLDVIGAYVARNSPQGRATDNRVVAAKAEAEAYQQTAAEQARQSEIVDRLTAARERGEEVGLRARTASEFEKLASQNLTGELKRQVDIINEASKARQQAANTSLVSRFETDQKAAREALGRTYEEQAAYLQARAYGAPGTDAFRQAKSGIEELQTLTEAKSTTGGFLKDMNYELMRGAGLGQAALSSLSRVAAKLSDKAFDKLTSLAFDGIGGSGGLLSGLTKLFGGGFAGGGYTGPGGVNEPAGLVHRCEVVPEAGPARSAGAALVNALRRNLPISPSGGLLPAGILGMGQNREVMA